MTTLIITDSFFEITYLKNTSRLWWIGASIGGVRTPFLIVNKDNKEIWNGFKKIHTFFVSPYAVGNNHNGYYHQHKNTQK